MRLVREDAVPKGLAMLNAGNAIAATISAPLGSLLGDHIGWRGAFFTVVPLALLALVWQWMSLPALPPRGDGQSRNVLSLLRRRQVALGMSSMWLVRRSMTGASARPSTMLPPTTRSVVGRTRAIAKLPAIAAPTASL